MSPKLKGCLVIHSLSAWALLLPFPNFHSFLSQTHTYASSILVITQMGHSNCFPPNPAPSCCPTPAGWISHKGCQTPAWKMRYAALVLLSLLLNEGQMCPHLSLAPFQCLWHGVFCHMGKMRMPRGHPLGFPQVQVLSGTLQPNCAHVVLSLGSNMHFQPLLCHSSYNCNATFLTFLILGKNTDLEFLEKANTV